MCEIVRKNTQGFREIIFSSYIRFRFLSTALVFHALEDILSLFYVFLLPYTVVDISRHALPATAATADPCHVGATPTPYPAWSSPLRSQ